MLLVGQSILQDRGITFYNKDNKAVLEMEMCGNIIKVNGRYRLDSNGWVSYNPNVVPESKLIEKTRIMVQNQSDVFKVRIHVFKWGITEVFDVFPNGPVLEDPFLQVAKQSIHT